jgi:hypothetical protein
MIRWIQAALVGDAVPPVGDAVPLIGGGLTLGRDALPLVGDAVPLVGGGLAVGGGGLTFSTGHWAAFSFFARDTTLFGGSFTLLGLFASKLHRLCA